MSLDLEVEETRWPVNIDLFDFGDRTVAGCCWLISTLREKLEGIVSLLKQRHGCQYRRDRDRNLGKAQPCRVVGAQPRARLRKRSNSNDIMLSFKLWHSSVWYVDAAFMFKAHDTVQLLRYFRLVFCSSTSTLIDS